MDIDSSDLESWFTQRPLWLQDAARRLLAAHSISADDLTELVILCKREAGVVVNSMPQLRPIPIPSRAFNFNEEVADLRLVSISEIRGVNALAPRKPLEFGTEPLTVVYGANGSGKTGYIRLLKHLCGGKGKATLHGDAFKSETPKQSCKVTLKIGDAIQDHDWNGETAVPDDLRSISIYDSTSAQVYVSEENEVTYEPELLSYFRVLVEVCEAASGVLATEIQSKVSSKPVLPQEFGLTKGATWFNHLSWATQESDVDDWCSWSEAREEELAALMVRLTEPNPTERAKGIRRTKEHIGELARLVAEHESKLSDGAFAALQVARTAAKEKRLAAETAANKVFASAPLDGLSSTTWRLLWEQARNFSEAEAYKGVAFPNISTDAVCVLCQQSLGEKARERLTSFEAFVKDSLEAEATKTELALATLLEGLKDLPTSKDIETKLDAAGFSQETEREPIRNCCESLRKRRKQFTEAHAVTDLPNVESAGILVMLANRHDQLETAAKGFDEDAKAKSKAHLQAQVQELSAKKWLSQQRKPILVEVSRLKEVHLLTEAQRLTHTRALSDKKSALAEELITAAFVSRFENELKELGATRLRVTLEKTNAPKGQVFHKVTLRGSTRSFKTAEILSEGEFRIVSIAAFLADVIGNRGNTPFIFDDPISSLDQDFEESTAARLVALARTKQVIIFTHRLSLLAMVEAAAETAGISHRVVSVQAEPWGTGEPNEPPLPAQKPKAALNKLTNERLQKARKIWSEQGTAAYQIEAKALCSDIRITIERLIENELLADVVQRFRRPINTLGKIEKLAKINAADCAFLDAMMTKYSRYEHAQPREAPVALPEPDEILEDLSKLKSWLDQFTSRPVPSN